MVIWSVFIAGSSLPGQRVGPVTLPNCCEPITVVMFDHGVFVMCVCFWVFVMCVYVWVFIEWRLFYVFHLNSAHGRYHTTSIRQLKQSYHQ